MSSAGKWFHPAFFLLAVAGCSSAGVHHDAEPPAVLLGMDERSIALDGSGLEARLERVLLKFGDPYALHATLASRDLQARNVARRLLIKAGVDPARIRMVDDPSNVLILDAYVAAVPDCAAGMRAPNASGTLEALGLCLRAEVLAREIAHPGDLVQPAHLLPANGARFGKAVEQWEAGRGGEGASLLPVLNGPSGNIGGSSSVPTASAGGLPPMTQLDNNMIPATKRVGQSADTGDTSLP